MSKYPIPKWDQNVTQNVTCDFFVCISFFLTCQNNPDFSFLLLVQKISDKNGPPKSWISMISHFSFIMMIKYINFSFLKFTIFNRFETQNREMSDLFYIGRRRRRRKNQILRTKMKTNKNWKNVTFSIFYKIKNLQIFLLNFKNVVPPTSIFHFYKFLKILWKYKNVIFYKKSSIFWFYVKY